MFRKMSILGLVFLMLVLAGCAPAQTSDIPTPTPGAQIANPASTFCIENGGQLEMRTGADGGQYGVCVFPDKTECEEWAYFRGECQPGAAVKVQEPAGQAENLAVKAAISVLAIQLGIAEDQISLKSVANETFSDACLGLAGPDEMCAMVLTDGYVVVLTAGGMDYTFHTNLDGTNVRQAQFLSR